MTPPTAAATTTPARVVLVHGSMDRAASFAKVARRLEELEVVRYDRRGYASRVGEPPATTLDEHVDDLLDQVGAGPAAVVGHSLGGVLALMAAVRAPARVTSVGAFESPMSWRPEWPRTSAGGNALAAGDPGDAAEAFLRGILGERVWSRLGSRTRAERRAEGPALVAELAALRAAAPYDPAAVPVPVLAGYGTESKPYHQEAARRLAAEAHDGELVVVEGSGHGVHLTHPADFAAFVRRVVQRMPSIAPCPTPPPST